MKLFIIESPNPMDLIQDRSEMQSLEKVCRMFGHEVATFFIKSKNDYIETIKYIATINEEHDKYLNNNEPLCLHISAHGDSKGLQFGQDSVKWENLYNMSKPLFDIFSSYTGDRILVISSCKAAYQSVTKKIKNLMEDDYIDPPSYLFTAGDKNVAWVDTLTCWTLLYRLIGDINLSQKKEVMEMLDKINSLKLDNITYFRWDSGISSYRKYSS
jgi:hypothetical protein